MLDFEIKQEREGKPSSRNQSIYDPLKESILDKINIK
jgi:hypothetical protein